MRALLSISALLAAVLSLMFGQISLPQASYPIEPSERAPSYSVESGAEGKTDPGYKQQGTQDSGLIREDKQTNKREPPRTQQAEDVDKERLTAYTGRLADYTAAMALATVALVIVAVIQAYILRQQRRTYQDTLATNKAVERAYVTISHYSPEPPAMALRLAFDGDGDGLAWASVRIENYGQTPARIERISLGVMFTSDPLPTEPAYPRAEPSGHFLVRNDHFDRRIRDRHPRQLVADALNGRRVALLVGYVEYTDMFQRRHCSGYARRYVRQAEGDNLILVPDRNYNYDKEC